MRVHLGVAASVLHVVPVLFLLRVEDRKLSILLAALATFLIAIEIALTPFDIAAPWTVYANHSLAVFVVWSATLLGHRTRANEKRVEEKRVEEIETMLTVCAWTRRVKVGENWVPFEEYLTKNLGMTLTHGITEDSAQKLMQDFRKSAS